MRYSIERKHAEVNLAYLAQYDHLTKLPNRILLKDRLDQALEQSQRDRELVAVLFLDLDRFKDINDSFGHNIGDMLLIEVADRLKTCIRKTDTIARFGGDEFIIILKKVHEASTVANTAQKIITVLEHPFQISGNEIFITTSTGIAIYPHCGEDSDTLIRNADSAMYRAKDRGRNNYQFFTPEMNAMVQKKFKLERELRYALERNEFELHYQPQIDLKTGRVSGLEALVRWNHPKAGMLHPAEFIEVLEETGLIVPVGEWVLETACAQNRKWQECGLPAHKMAVNLSARQFSHASLVETVSNVLERTGLVAAESLELEITESLLMEHTRDNNTILSQLKKMGVIISIDDFGTGYSSLSYLKRFSLDTLKIDRSFVMDVPGDPDDVAIVSAIIAMAHSLRLRVIAEGVETLEQLEFLRSQQCDEIQGYLICKPAPAEEIYKFLEEDLNLEQRLKTAASG